MAGMGALTGLTGYMTLGLGAKPKPGVIRLNDDEALIIKDSESILNISSTHSHMLHLLDEGLAIGLDGKPSRKASVEWPAPPEEIGKTGFSFINYCND
jgi:hypothetical protein